MDRQRLKHKNSSAWMLGAIVFIFNTKIQCNKIIALKERVCIACRAYRTKWNVVRPHIHMEGLRNNIRLWTKIFLYTVIWNHTKLCVCNGDSLMQKETGVYWSLLFPFLKWKCWRGDCFAVGRNIMSPGRGGNDQHCLNTSNILRKFAKPNVLHYHISHTFHSSQIFHSSFLYNM